MSPRTALALLALLAGCTPPPPATTPQGQCQQQVDQDPAVKALIADGPLRSSEPRYQEDLAQARRKAVSDCLTAKGLQQRGGVEPVSRAKFGLGWF